MDLGELFLTIALIALSSIPLALTLWALLDCARRPSWAWALSGRGQASWMAAILMGILVCPVGMVISAYYLLRVRGDVAAAEEGRIPDLTGL